MSEITPVTIELAIGHTDLRGKVHSRVTFGQRINGKKMFEIDGDPQSSISTQYQDLVMRAAITEFGELKMPVALTVLLNLDSIDREDLAEGFARLMNESAGESRVEYLSETKVKLAYGYERNGLVYDVATFGTRLTGMDEVAADREKLEGLRRHCFLAGRQVTRLSESKGESVLDGPMSLEIFETLDAIDIGAIRAASEVWRNSFRRPGARVPHIGRGAKRAAARGGDRLERDSHS
jgi:hypothetical protein